MKFDAGFIYINTCILIHIQKMFEIKVLLVVGNAGTVPKRMKN